MLILKEIEKEEELVNYSFHDSFSLHPLEAFHQVKTYCQQSGKKDVIALGAYLNQQLIGFLVLNFTGISQRFLRKKACLLAAFSVDERWRRRGLALEILTLVEKKIFFYDSDIEELMLLVDKENQAAIHLYHKANYSLIMEIEAEGKYHYVYSKSVASSLDSFYNEEK